MAKKITESEAHKAAKIVSDYITQQAKASAKKGIAKVKKHTLNVFSKLEKAVK